MRHAGRCGVTTRPLSPAHRAALLDLLRGPLTRRADPLIGDGWIAQDGGFHALVTVRTLHQRGLVQRPLRLAVLTIAGRQAAQRIAREHNTMRPAPQMRKPC